MREALRDIPEIADNGVELDALAALSAEQQAAAVGAVQNGGAPSVRAAIATSAQPTGPKAANADNPFDAILEQIRQLGENERESLWDALAGQWYEEISRAFACRLLKTDGLLQREALSAGATPSHPDVRGTRSSRSTVRSASGFTRSAVSNGRSSSGANKTASDSADLRRAGLSPGGSIIRRNSAADLLQTQRGLTIDTN